MNGYETVYYLLDLNSRTLDEAFIVEHETFTQIFYPQKPFRYKGEWIVVQGVCSFFYGTQYSNLLLSEIRLHL